MKNKLNIYSDIKIESFLTELFSKHQLSFMKFDNIEKRLDNTSANIIIMKNIESTNLINLKKLSDNSLVLTSIKNLNINLNNQLILTPISINKIKTIIEKFVENLKIKFHDITIVNEKLTNVKNKSFCYLTKLESEILSHLITEKETTKKFIQENILNIKSTIKTNSLDSHLTRIRKKMYQINTSLKIHSKNEKLLIIV